MLTNREIFNNIATSWYGYRHHTRFRVELETLSRYWQGGRLLNIGCGHGPDFLPFKDKFELHGIDFSSGMIGQARKYADKFTFKVDLAVADLQALPYRNHVFDCAVAIATYHHVRGGSTGLSAFRELRRVLKRDAEAFITVWNKWQPRFWFSRKEVNVPWHTKKSIYQRYYYLYSRPEIVMSLKSAGFSVMKFNAGNCDKVPLAAFANNICLLVKAV